MQHVASTPNPYDRKLKPREAAAICGYTDVDSFLDMAKARGIPGMSRINARVIRFDVHKLNEWIDSQAA